MPRPRLLLIALAAAAGLLALAAVVLFGLVRLSWFERQAEQRLSSTLGWPTRIGDLSIAYYPLPRIEADRIVLPAADGVGATPLVEVEHLSLTLPWRTLAGRGEHLARLELRGPRLHLAEDAGGRRNWDGLAEKVARLGGEGPAAFSIGEVEVTEGGVDYASPVDGSWRIAGIQLSARDVIPGEPFDVELRLGGESGGQTFHLSLAGRAMLDPDRDVYAADELTLDGWVGGEDLPLAGIEWDGAIDAVHVDLGAGLATLRGAQARTLGVELAGEASLATGEQSSIPSFALRSGSFSPRAVASALGRPLPDTTDPAALAHARFDATGSWTEDALTISRVEGELDDSRFSGEATWPAGEAPPRFRLVLDRLDLDRYLPPAAGPDNTPQAAIEGLRESLQELDLEAAVSIGEARAAGIVARQLTIRLEPVRAEPAD